MVAKAKLGLSVPELSVRPDRVDTAERVFTVTLKIMADPETARAGGVVAKINVASKYRSVLFMVGKSGVRSRRVEEEILNFEF